MLQWCAVLLCYWMSGRLADSLGWKRVSYRAVQAGVRERCCVCLCLAVLVFPDTYISLSEVLCMALLLVRLQTHLSPRETCTGGRQTVRGSVSARIMVGPGTPKCLQVSAVLCVVL
jgi:hypothetical protein